MVSRRYWGVAAVAAAAGASVASAQPVIGFVETFDTDAANWTNTARGALNHSDTGGVGGSGYVAWTVDAEAIGEQGVTVFRGEASRGASGGAFTGNWLTAPVTTLTIDVLHDAAEPMELFVRFAGIANFPGVFIHAPGTIPAGEWTTLTFDIDVANPLLSAETDDPEQVPALYSAVFSDLANIQVVFIKQDGSTLTGPVTFGLDNVRIVPAPGGAAVLFGLAGAAARRRRR